MMDDSQLTKMADRLEKQRLEELSNRLEKRRSDSWRRFFDERQRRLIINCSNYAVSDPAGLPGHQLMLIVSKMTDLLDDAWDDDVHGKYV
jgi:uncharacterized protein YeeX (DUF496 family)